MRNLNDLGLTLQTLQVTDYATLIASLNYNFGQILNLPGWVGNTGPAGPIGNDGSDGQRGNIWIFAQLTLFSAQYPSITSPTQITQGFINNALNVDQATLLLALNVSEIIDGDVVVIPDGSVLQLNETLGEFEHTGTSFVQGNNGVTETRVIELINTHSAAAATPTGFVKYDSRAKNFPDGSTAGVNNTSNPDSILDINSTGAGPGVPIGDHKFLAPFESTIPQSYRQTTITGSAQVYHNLVQATQNLTGKTTNEYGPGANDSASLAVIQNNYSNGIILGSRLSTVGFKEFSRIYRDEEGLRLTSDYSIYQDEYGEIFISRDEIIFDAQDQVTINTKLEVIGDSNFQGNIIHLNMEITDDSVIIGDDTNNALFVEIQNELRLTKSDLLDVNFLGTDSSGIVKKIMTLDTTSLTNDDVHVPSSKLLTSLLGNINTSISNNASAINEINTSLATTFFNNDELGVGIDLNQVTDNGTYVFDGVFLPINVPTDSLYTELALNVEESILLVKEFTKSNDDIAYFQMFISGSYVWTRHGYHVNLSTLSWGDWKRLLSAEEIDSLISNIIINTGSRLSNGGALGSDHAITIDHESIVPTEVNGGLSNNVSDQFIKEITFDGFGHPSQVTIKKPLGLTPIGSVIHWFPYDPTNTYTYASAKATFFDANGVGKLTTIGSKIYDLRGWTLLEGQSSGIPDLRGKVIFGAGDGEDAFSTTIFHDLYVEIGRWFHTLTIDELPAHTHGITDPGHDHDIFQQSHNHVPTSVLNGSEYYNRLLSQDGTGTSDTTNNDPTEPNILTSAQIQWEFPIIRMVGSTTGITINSEGNGQAKRYEQPSIALFTMVFTGEV